MKVPFLDLELTYVELKEEIDSAYRRVMNSGWFLLGEELSEFEKNFSRYISTQYSLGLGSGLDALVLSLKALGIKQGDEVIVPAQTFIATWFAVTECGATPVPVDVKIETGNIHPDRILDKITSETRAIIPVHLFGQAAEMDAIVSIANKFNLKIVEDVAQAHGAMWKGERCGSFGNVGAFSFYPGKNLGAFSDGGAVTTNSKDVFKRISLLRNYGCETKYDHELIGVNSRLDELQSAILGVKLKYLDVWTARRRETAAHYESVLSAIPDVETLYVSNDSNPVWHLYPIRVEKRDEVQKILGKKGIQTNIHYPTCPHLSKAYCEMELGKGSFPNAESWAEQELSLPIGPQQSEEATFAVCKAIKEVFGVK